jgi:long-chain acyl-CoA synthetase
MAVLRNILEALALADVSLEAFGRNGECARKVSGAEFVARVEACRRAFREGDFFDCEVGGRRAVALLFRPEETVEFLVAAFAAIAERFTVVPLFPNWSAETQRQYLEAYRIRAMAVADGFRARAEDWRGDVLRTVLEIDLSAPVTPGQPAGDIFPHDFPRDHACAYIFTSGTSGKLAKLTEITLENLEAAIENIESLDFLYPGMTLHSPLSTSHIFAFVVVLGFLALRPRRLIFSDIQYLTRLPQSRTGKVAGLILVPIVLNRLRAAFYEKLVARELPAEMRSLARIPLSVRRALKRILSRAEEAVLEVETSGRTRALSHGAVQLVRRLLGPRIRERLGSPDFVVVGGAKPNLRAMAFLEVMGIRCLQGWGMTETTGPLAVCHLGDRFQGAFGTCGDLFPRATAAIEDGELIVGGPQIARGYLEPGGAFVAFNGRKRTGDYAEFDGAGRLKILGKASDRITTENGINYNPIPFEEELLALDLEREHALEEAVVIGDGQPRLGVVFFLRPELREDGATRAYLRELLREFNRGRPVDERLEVSAVSELPFKEAGVLGPSGKLVRRRVEEEFARVFPEPVGAGA